MSTKFDEFLQDQLKDPEFKKEYDALQAERDAQQAKLTAKLGIAVKNDSDLRGLAEREFE